jgi:hypothetical protein
MHKPFPFLVETSTKTDLIDWAEKNRAEIEGLLRDHGLCWLRGFAATAPDAAQRLMHALGTALVEDVFWSTPRSRVAGKTFTATEYPARETIPLHSEMAYLPRYPRLLCFHALVCAQSGGQTTWADLDLVSAEVPNLVERFLARGVLYRRVFRDGLDIPLAAVFGTDDPAQIRHPAAEQGMQAEPMPDGALRLSHTGRGGLRDETGKNPIWFNQMHLFHPARLNEATRHSMVALFGEDGLPRQAVYGDGEAIADETVAAIQAAFARHTSDIAWQAGDVVLIDNLRHAHGRRPFTGERRVHVAMGMPQTNDTRSLFSLP